MRREQLLKVLIKSNANINTIRHLREHEAVFTADLYLYNKNSAFTEGDYCQSQPTLTFLSFKR